MSWIRSPTESVFFSKGSLDTAAGSLCGSYLALFYELTS